MNPNPPTPDTDLISLIDEVEIEVGFDDAERVRVPGLSSELIGSLRRELDSVAEERDAALAALEAEHREVERLREAATDVVAILADEFRCPICAKNGYGHRELCPVFKLAVALAPNPPQTMSAAERDRDTYPGWIYCAPCDALVRVDRDHTCRAPNPQKDSQ